jgi:4-amino-4-deoxy-L-arabinose transferase-like glycosyltransferase
MRVGPQARAVKGQLPTARRLWTLYAVAAVSFLPALGFHYTGEEAIFPVSSLEMWFRGQWVEQLLYGASQKHNPLFNWLIIPIASLAGWEHMLTVARALTIAATIGTGLTVAWLARALGGGQIFAAWVALVYLTLADLFFYRGWLAYVDPLFGFFVFGAIAALWVACERRSAGLLVAAVAALTCAFMTKAYTAYVFYATTALVLLWRRDYRAFLYGRASGMAHLAAAALPALWLLAVPENTGQGSRMFAEILAKLAPTGLVDYVLKLILYPADTALRLAPALLVAAWYCWRRRATGMDAHGRTALAIALLGYVPYWLAPSSSIRYLVPLYPLAALVLARALWESGERAVTVTQRWLIAAVAVKLVLALAVFPWYQERYRGLNYETAARDIHALAAGWPLYTLNVSASGLSVTAHLDILRLPQPPLTFPPQRWESGFVIGYRPDPAIGRAAAHYRLGGSDLYLLCRGAACEGAGHRPADVGSK